MTTDSASPTSDTSIPHRPKAIPAGTRLGIKLIKPYFALFKAIANSIEIAITAKNVPPSILFTFLSERYERRSVMLTSNLVFSEWDKIFKDPMTTAAAIDRLVHHSTIIEMAGKSVRAEEAKRRNNGGKTPPKKKNGKAGDGEDHAARKEDNI